jgi:hypothetical protein
MSLVEDIKKVPPVTRFLCGTTMVITLSTMLAVVERRSLVYTKGLVVGRWQVRSIPYRRYGDDTDANGRCRFGESLPRSFMEVG